MFGKWFGHIRLAETMPVRTEGKLPDPPKTPAAQSQEARHFTSLWMLTGPSQLNFSCTLEAFAIDY